MFHFGQFFFSDKSLIYQSLLLANLTLNYSYFLNLTLNYSLSLGNLTLNYSYFLFILFFIFNYIHYKLFLNKSTYYKTAAVLKRNSSVLRLPDVRRAKVYFL